MPFKIKIIWSAILLALGFLGFFGFKVQDWDSAMAIWLDSETWLINHAAHPGLVILAVVLLLGTVVGPEIWWFVRRHLEAMELKGVLPRNLPQMPLPKLAIYLRDKSSWGYTAETDEFSVSVEIVRAAQTNEIPIIGISADHPDITDVIDFNFWRTALIDDVGLFDFRNQISTSRQGHRADGPVYRNLSVPRMKVEQVWPPATLSFRAYIKLRRILADLVPAKLFSRAEKGDVRSQAPKS